MDAGGRFPESARACTDEHRRLSVGTLFAFFASAAGAARFRHHGERRIVFRDRPCE